MEDSVSLKRKADAAFKSKRYTEAIELYNQLLEKDASHTICWLNIGAAYIEKHEWEKAREACEKYIKEVGGNASEPTQTSLLAKAHYRMALACLELGIKDGTAFGPAIYYRNAMRDAERAWQLAQSSSVLQQPIVTLLGRLRDQLRQQQQTMANQNRNDSVQNGVLAPRDIQDTSAPSHSEELLVWGLVWLRALLRNLNPEEATSQSPKTVDIIDLFDRACLPDSPDVLLEILTKGVDECGLYERQLQVVLSLQSGKWPDGSYKTFSRADWLLPTHCIGKFSTPLTPLIELWPSDHHIVAVIIRGTIVPPLDVDGSAGDARALREWLMAQTRNAVSIFDNLVVDPIDPPTLQIDLPRFEVVTGCVSTLWLIDLTDVMLVAKPMVVSALQEPSRKRWDKGSG